ncbi:WD40/YVTN/BNR-like repeat-containing protein [Parendozoicomonas haliclonae]|uniref:Ycf48-like protein n=1 Tax=Parendozoicomonas haliclonae TaxID=1960125 RepID=A0A1X7AR85_9GAMM|nr:sialidase family protein [Parendozoicomonas haliclonae]SMA50590.1 hypothetical protein EHSB41UT_04407 [Parendozoicomonas haliclonae]
MHKATKKILALAFILILTGCASKSSSLKKFSKEKDGIVVLSISVNSDIDLTPDFLRVATPKDVKRSLNSIIYRTNEETSHHSGLFVGSLPEGKYYITQIKGLSGSFRIHPKNDSLHFEIRAGEVSDLGRVLISKLEDETYRISRSTTVNNNKNLMASNLGEYKKTITSLPVSNKETTQLDLESEKTALNGIKHITNITEGKNGELFATSRMGEILTLTKNNKWERVSISPNLASITSLSEYNDNQFIISDDLGFIYLVKKQDGTHKEVDRGNLPGGKIYFLSHSPNKDKWFIGLRHDGEGILYTADRLNNADWEEVRKDRFDNDGFSGISYKIWAWNYNGGFAYLPKDSDSVFCYRYDNNEWKKNALPKSSYINDISHFDQSSSFGILEGVMNHTLYVTKNCGKTWTLVPSESLPNRTPPLLTPDGEIYLSGGIPDNGVYTSTDFGGTWSKASKQPAITKKVWGTKNNGLFGKNDQGRVRVSTDNGKNWKLTR